MPDVKVKEWVGCLPCEQRHSGNLLISAAHASESPVWPTDGEVTVVEVVWLRYKQMRRRVTTDNWGRRAMARVARCGLRTPISTKLARVNHPGVS